MREEKEKALPGADSFSLGRTSAANDPRAHAWGSAIQLAVTRRQNPKRERGG